jgi:hypothetical protein
VTAFPPYAGLPASVINPGVGPSKMAFVNPFNGNKCRYGDPTTLAEVQSSNPLGLEKFTFEMFYYFRVLLLKRLTTLDISSCFHSFTFEMFYYFKNFYFECFAIFRQWK